MIYNVINSISIFCGAFVGRTIGKNLSEDQIHSILVGASLALVILGIQGGVATNNSLLMIASLCIGGVIGAGFDIDGKFQGLGKKLRGLVKNTDDHFTEGLVSLIMIHVVGSMAILGPIAAALDNDPSILIFKAILDFSSSLIFSATYGFGVSLSGVVVLVYQGIIYLIAGLLVPVVTPEVTAEISAIGSVLLVALSLNILEITQIKVSNFIPGIFGPIVYHLIQVLIP